MTGFDEGGTGIGVNGIGEVKVLIEIDSIFTPHSSIGPHCGKGHTFCH